MLVEKNVPLQHCNTFGIAARAETLVRIRSQDDIRQFLADPLWGRQPVFVLGGGSNVVLTGDVAPVVLKMEIMGMRLLRETDKHWIVEIGAGERWHDMVAWTLAQGYTGLENMALIPGTVGAAPVQNIGATGWSCRIASTPWTRSIWSPASSSASMLRNAPSATVTRCSSMHRLSPSTGP
jgi:UDP-N-acetylmuramate dehydrogenase